MGNTLYEGLVDATTEGELEFLQKKYDDSKKCLPAFCNLFVINKARVLKHTGCVLCVKRQAPGVPS